MSNTSDKVKGEIHDATEKVKDVAHNVAEKTKDVAHNVGEKVKDAAHNVAEKTKDVAHNVAEKTKDVGTRRREDQGCRTAPAKRSRTQRRRSRAQAAERPCFETKELGPPRTQAVLISQDQTRPR